MEAACSAEMLVSTNKITWHHNPQHHTLNQECASVVCQVAHVTKFSVAAPNILSMITAVIFPYIQEYVSVHMHQAESAR